MRKYNFDIILFCAVTMLVAGSWCSAQTAKRMVDDRNLAFSDEFNASSLDTVKWWDHNPEWKGKFPSIFMPRNVSLAGGSLNIVMKKESVKKDTTTYSYTTGSIKSRKKILYGYFEARCKIMNSRGSSAFWLYDDNQQYQTELDVFEICGGDAPKEHSVFMNAHVGHGLGVAKPLAMPQVYNHTSPLRDDFHVYAIDWREDSVIYYFDNNKIGAILNQYWHKPMSIMFDSETMPEWFGLPLDSQLPSTFLVDYIRVWNQTAAPGK